VVRVNEALKNELNRQPSVAEIAERIGVPQDDVLEAMEMSTAYTPVSIDAAPGGADGDEGRRLGEAIGGEDPNLERVEMRDVLARAMEHLNPRERAILAMRFYDELSQSEIAKRLGISQMHVSRLQRAAQEQLRQYLSEEAQAPP